jgi:hypothetical protein
MRTGPASRLLSPPSLEKQRRTRAALDVDQSSIDDLTKILLQSMAIPATMVWRVVVGSLKVSPGKVYYAPVLGEPFS